MYGGPMLPNIPIKKILKMADTNKGMYFYTFKHDYNNNLP